MCTISLCMIVKNEEAVLGRCLESAADLVDEIVIVDTGSTDGTKKIARKFTDKLFDFPWVDDLAAARNFSFEQASGDYCMWLDADDVIAEDDRSKFRAMRKQLLPQADVVMMPYHTAFDPQGQPTFTYHRERVVRNEARFRWAGVVHEAITPAGEIRWSDAAVSHKKEGSGDPDRNLCIYEAQLAAGKALDPRNQFYYARELWYHSRFEEAAKVLTTFLDSGKGWLENQIEACRLLSQCMTALGRDGDALSSLLRSLTLDTPRAEVCCDIGGWFLAREQWRQAAFWYELALTRKRDDTSGAFVSPDCYGYLPAIELCVCWYHLGDVEKAKAFNELAASFRPEDPFVLQNRTFFSSLSFS
ncbi:glycosyltransferase family 2 protein [Pseudoflavonifractor sp.]|uniref:glycosyltransferase family 2 protein n=1 Tax=Pseudoflavonifractor sp. TaxID=1980281 RepID=UPI003D92D675